MQRDVILTCAITGGGPNHKSSPHVPITPAQIATSALEAAEAGAAIVHLHVRDPETGNPSMDGALYAETVERIREKNSDVLINLTTGPGARYVPSLQAPIVADTGSNMRTPAERTAHATALRPDVCSLDVLTMNYGEGTLVNTAPHVREMAKAIEDAGAISEIEVFDLGHIRLAQALIKEGAIGKRHFFQLCLGISWGADADYETMKFMASRLPEGALWSGFGIGAREFPMLEAALELGGHVRVGLEDNLYLARGVLAETNAVLVDEAVKRITAAGHNVATPAQTREIFATL